MPMSSKKIQRLISHIEQERGRCAPALKSLHEDISLWYSAYEMNNTELKRNIPFRGASAAFQPLLFEQTKLLYGKVWAMQFRHRPLISAAPSDQSPEPTTLTLMNELEKNLDHTMYSEIEVRRKAMPITLEGLITGMGVAFVPFRVEQKMTPVWVPGKEEPDLIPQVTYMNADLQFTPLAHCEWPPEACSIERTRWFSRKLWWSADELVEMSRSPRVDKKAVEKILQTGEDPHSDFQQRFGDLINMPLSNSPNYMCIDWWGWFRDADYGGYPVLYNIVYHPQSREVLVAEVNPYEDHSIPVAVWNFFPRPGKLLGIGIGRLLTDLNGSLNEIWNQRVNAGRIANTKMFAIRKGSGVQPSEKMYPGKRFYVTNPANDIRELALGDVKQSSYADENNIWQVADRVVSTNEYMRGNQTISRPNASGQLSLINIAEENISIIGDNLNIFWSRIGRLVYSRQRQYMPAQKLLPSLPEDQGKMVLQSLSSRKITFGLAAADERINPEAERQKLSAAYQMYTGYYNQLLQYAQLLANPQMPPLIQMIAAKSMRAMTEFMKRIGRNLNLKGFDGFLVELTDEQLIAGQSTLQSPPESPGGETQGGAGQLPQQTSSGADGGGSFPRAVAGGAEGR